MLGEEGVCLLFLWSQVFVSEHFYLLVRRECLSENSLDFILMYWTGIYFFV